MDAVSLGEKLVMGVVVLIGLLLRIIFVPEARQSASVFINGFLYIYVAVFFIFFLTGAVWIGTHLYKTSDHPNKRKNMHFYLISAGILLAAFGLIVLVL